MTYIVNANALHIPLADKSVHCCVTSPPYWGLRDYGVGGQLGLEQSPDEYVANMVAVFREVWRVLRDDGTCWINLGDSYAGSGGAHTKDHANPGLSRSAERDGVPHYQQDDGRGPDKTGYSLKPKDLVGIPWRVAFALQADGWYLRSDIIWSKPNPMPESVTDRPTKAHEYLFLLSKSPRYYYDADAVREESTDPIGSAKRYEAPFFVGDKHESGGYSANGQRHTPGIKTFDGGRNRRTVWTIATATYSGAHFVTYPPALVEPCIKAGTSEHGVCPTCGAPLERVSEKGEPILNAWSKKGPGNYNFETKQPDPIDWDGGSTLKHSRNHTTIGWQPTCTCPAADPVPAIVLDPFAGSGATLLVARKLGRRGVGLDLSYSYLHEQARERLGLTALDAWTNGSAVNDNGYHDLPMFSEVTE